MGDYILTSVEFMEFITMHLELMTMFSPRFSIFFVSLAYLRCVSCFICFGTVAIPTSCKHLRQMSEIESTDNSLIASTQSTHTQQVHNETKTLGLDSDN